jgi:hypothetical protein
MEDLTRRALIRAIAAFSGVFLFGSAVVFSVQQLSAAGEDDGGTPPTSSSTQSPTSTPTGPATPEAWLAWVPGGMPEGFSGNLLTPPQVDTATTATADIVWMTASADATGAAVDVTSGEYLIPVDATGVEPAFASFVPEPERNLVEGLDAGEGVLSESAASLRGLGEGSTMTFQTGSTVTIAGTLPDVIMGGYELLVTRATGEDIGISHERYALLTVKPNAATDPEQISLLLEPYLPDNAPYPFVEVRAPGETRFLRANDRQAPLVALKKALGEFTAIPPLAEPFTLEIDPDWVGAHIASEPVILLGTVTCHTEGLESLRGAMKELNVGGNRDLVQGHGDCFDPTADPGDPGGTIGAAAFGAAIELNRQDNPPGADPLQDPLLVKTMARWGFGWGGRDLYPQGAQFQLSRIAKPQG